MVYTYIDFNNEIFCVILGEDNSVVKNSYKIQKTSDIKSFLKKIKDDERYSDTTIGLRNFNGLVREWEAHNLLYNIGILKDRTGSVDFELNPKWYFKVGYFLISLFYWK